MHGLSLFVAFCCDYVVFGACVTLIGATVPTIMQDLGWDYLATGAVLAAGSVGYLGSTFVCGVLVRRLGPQKVITWGLAAQGVGMALFGLSPAPAYNVAVMLLVGLGEGGSEVVTNYGVVRLEKGGQSRLMNLAHAAFTVGAIAGPVGVGSLLSAGLDWRLLYLAMGLLCAGMAVVFLLLSFAGIHSEPEHRIPYRRVLAQLLRQPLAVLLALVIFLYVGAEMGLSSWIAQYYVEVWQIAPATSAYMVSLFWVGLLAGRLIVSAGYRHHRQEPLLLGLTLLALGALVLALLCADAWLAAGLFLLSGLGFSAVYPVVMALVGRHFQHEQSLAIGLVSTAGGIGSLVFPFAMAAIAERYSMARGFWAAAFVALLMAASAAGVSWQTRSR